MKTQTDKPESQAPPHRLTALIAEDDAQIAYLVQFLLEREGYLVLLARDGWEAKRLVDEIAPPSLVILDVMMPHADGLEVLAHLRARQDWADTPVIMLTAGSQEKDINRAFEAKATDYVVKPFLPEDLKARIHRLVPPRE